MRKYKRGLTAKHEKYCQARADGAGYADAYKAAGFSPDGSRDTARKNGYRIENTGAYSADIVRRINDLKQAASDGAIMDRAARMALLSRVAVADDTRPADIVRAVDVMARMAGDYTGAADVRVTIASESERAAAWRSILAGDDVGQE